MFIVYHKFLIKQLSKASTLLHYCIITFLMVASPSEGVCKVMEKLVDMACIIACYNLLIQLMPFTCQHYKNSSELPFTM